MGIYVTRPHGDRARHFDAKKPELVCFSATVSDRNFIPKLNTEMTHWWSFFIRNPKKSSETGCYL
jgi:hypothetical protein